jgi:1-acyl-sn-glycerol-3-phosphate acyltransferase
VSVIHTALLALALLIWTPIVGGWVVIAALFRVRDRPGSVHDLAPRVWCGVLLAASGVRVVEHGLEHKGGRQHIFVANHLSYFDVMALATHLRWIKFVAKAELFRTPILGAAMAGAGMVPIQRANRKAAFGSYAVATQRIADGASVAVYPEGTRGDAYPLRSFKKGPFVLAIQAQAPVVPMLVYGALDVMPRGTLWVRPGTIHLHYLPPIPTTGLTYGDRDLLARRTYEAMAQCLRETYGIASPPYRAA